MSAFDGIAAAVVDGTSAVFGDMATWVNNGVTYSALVKYKDEAGSDKLGEVKYGVDHWSIEIKNSDFPGLALMVNKQQKPDITVNVRGTALFFTGITADSISDGLCSKVTLRMKPS